MTDNAWFLVGMMIATVLIAVPFAIVFSNLERAVHGYHGRKRKPTYRSKGH